MPKKKEPLDRISLSPVWELLNKETGELTPTIEAPRKAKHVFPGGWVFMGLVYITKLIDANLSGKEYQLALLLMREAGWNGICDKSYAEIAAMIGTQKSRMPQLIKALEEHNIVVRVGGQRARLILINPTFCWRGTAEEQHHALEEWAKHKKIGMVPKERLAETA